MPFAQDRITHRVAKSSSLSLGPLAKNMRFCRREETKTSHLGHATFLAQLLADDLEKLVVLLNAASHVCNLGVSRAVVARVTKPIAVWALLLHQALKLGQERGSWASLLLEVFCSFLLLEEGVELPAHSRLFLIIDLNLQMVGFWGFGVLGFLSYKSYFSAEFWKTYLEKVVVLSEAFLLVYDTW